MNVLRSIIMAFACFSAIPMPRVDWTENNMRYMMAAFPLVGLAVGGCVWLWHLFCGALSASVLLHAVGLTLVPIVLTGGIHMDGFADVVDARASHAEPERKRAILKDPHVGAFAVLGIVCYVLAYCALAREVSDKCIPLMCLVPALSRCLSGLAAILSQPSSKTGMLAWVSTPASTKSVRIALVCILAATAVAAVVLNPVVGLAMIVLAALTLAYVLRLAQREFGGISGDLLGYYLQVAELVMLACVALVGKLV